MHILIVGGAGYVGSHANLFLNQCGDTTVVLDNLSRGHRELVQCGEFVQGDVGDAALLDKLFQSERFDAVMHFSAFASVGESVHRPDMYYQNNVTKTLVLLDAMVRHQVNCLVFSSTCATFGSPQRIPIAEDHPQNPINPYGWSKLMVEKILADYDAAFGLRSCPLRYFNAAGADPEAKIGEWHDPETHLIPLVFDAAAGKRETISIFGNDYSTPDGTCIRDYIHVFDLADAHRKAVLWMKETNRSGDFNLGVGRGYSVLEMIDLIEKTTGHSVKRVMAARREGDPSELIGACEKAAKILHWEPKYGIEEILAHAWKWYSR